LALEKIIKALVCKATAEVPPKSHSLVRLAELARIELNVEKTEFLDEMTGWCLSGRYPEFLPDEPTEVQAENLMLETIKCHIWLTSQL
jgi:HEPN domain-containing protein